MIMPDMQAARSDVRQDVPVLDNTLSTQVTDPKVFACPGDTKGLASEDRHELFLESGAQRPEHRHPEFPQNRRHHPDPDPLGQGRVSSLLAFAGQHPLCGRPRHARPAIFHQQMIRLEHLSKNFRGRPALQDLCLEIKAGEIFGLLGHNGAGKSTTFGLILGQLRPTSGEAFVRGISVTAGPPGSPATGRSHLRDARVL